MRLPCPSSRPLPPPPPIATLPPRGKGRPGTRADAHYLMLRANSFVGGASGPEKSSPGAARGLDESLDFVKKKTTSNVVQRPLISFLTGDTIHHRTFPKPRVPVLSRDIPSNATSINCQAILTFITLATSSIMSNLLSMHVLPT
jgi:hypothetical protein